MLAFMFAIAIYPFVPPIHTSASLDLFSLVPLLFGGSLLQH